MPEMPQYPQLDENNQMKVPRDVFKRAGSDVSSMVCLEEARNIKADVDRQGKLLR